MSRLRSQTTLNTGTSRSAALFAIILLLATMLSGVPGCGPKSPADAPVPDSAPTSTVQTKPDPAYDPKAYLSDAEMITAGGVRLTMTYDEVLAIVGEPEESYDNSKDVKSIVKNGYHYGFYRINDGFAKDYPLPRDGKYYLLNITALESCTDPLPRGIRIGDDIQDVFDKFPTQDRVLKKWAIQTVYGKQQIGQPRAFLEFTTVLGTYRVCVTTTTQVLNIHFSKQNKVIRVELLFEQG